MKHTPFASALALVTACSTESVSMPSLDITEERIYLHLADDCNLVKEPGGLYLKCGEESMFSVGDDCRVVVENKKRMLDCGG